MNPNVNSHDILALATGVITINSKVGAEALTKGMNVITFGKAFYTNKDFAPHFNSWSEFQSTVATWKKSNQPLAPSDNWVRFLEQVWENSFANELYDLKPENVKSLAQAIAKL